MRNAPCRIGLAKFRKLSFLEPGERTAGEGLEAALKSEAAHLCLYPSNAQKCIAFGQNREDYLYESRMTANRAGQQRG